jgi:predicted AAA+ superfamily ATPase
MFERYAAKPITTALSDTPVVMLIGPCQCGKTTLVRRFARDEREYVTLDDHTTLESARSDPSGFIRGFDRVIVDEVQRAPELLRAIKQAVDMDRLFAAPISCLWN